VEQGLTLPATLSRVLDPLRSCFTAPTFETFTALVAGLVAQPVGRTVCGMLTGAGLARVWHHARAHRFFSAARWCPHQLGLQVAELVVTHLLTPGAPITVAVAVDDTLFRRRGKKVHGVGWFHDGSAAGGVKLGFGNNWVVAAIVVTLPFCTRPVALPVLVTLAVKGGERSKPDLARDLLDALAERFPDRRIDLVADAAYGAGVFAGLGDDMTITTRARSNAAFFEPTPPRTGKRGRPRLKGDRIGTPADIARSATWKTVSVTRYGTTATCQIAERTCLWFGTWRTDPVRVILLRDTAPARSPRRNQRKRPCGTSHRRLQEPHRRRRGLGLPLHTARRPRLCHCRGSDGPMGRPHRDPRHDGSRVRGPRHRRVRRFPRHPCPRRGTTRRQLTVPPPLTVTLQTGRASACDRRESQQLAGPPRRPTRRRHGAWSRRRRCGPHAVQDPRRLGPVGRRLDHPQFPAGERVDAGVQEHLVGVPALADVPALPSGADALDHSGSVPGDTAGDSDQLAMRRSER
jgi:hypothetical protein